MTEPLEFNGLSTAGPGTGCGKPLWFDLIKDRMRELNRQWGLLPKKEKPPEEDIMVRLHKTMRKAGLE